MSYGQSIFKTWEWGIGGYRVPLQNHGLMIGVLCSLMICRGQIRVLEGTFKFFFAIDGVIGGSLESP